MLNAAGSTTNNYTSPCTKIVFTITAQKRWSRSTFTSATFMPAGGSGANGTFPYGASISIQRIQTGSLPLSGNFVISCLDPKGNI
jgi:hypothetical protein